MLTTVLILLAGTVGAGWIAPAARALVALAAITTGIVMLVTSGGEPSSALAAAVLMAAGSVALGGLYFSPRIRLAFGFVTALPFAFVAVAALPLLQSAETSATASDLVWMAGAGVVALLALCVGRPERSESSSRQSSEISGSD